MKLHILGIAIPLSLCFMLPIVAGAQGFPFTTLHSFSVFPQGAQPEATLMQAGDGNFYGTTSAGGTLGGTNGGSGTIFRMSPTGTITTLYTFTGGNDGGVPYSTLVQGTDGSLYGTCYGGGDAYGDGTIFKITTSGTFSVLYTFGTVTDQYGDPLDGSGPEAGLIQARDGNFYGTTAFGGANGDGEIFEITANGTLTVLYSFGTVEDGYGDPLDGASPACALVQGPDGNLYGTCAQGGANGYGDVFQFTTGGTLNVLYSFGASLDSNQNPLDGGQPDAGLVLGKDGNFYGTCSQGGANSLYGTVFQVSSNGTLNTLYSFTGESDGASPGAGALVQVANGTLYGTTENEGDYGVGTIFNISTNGGTITTVHAFSAGIDGANPVAGLNLAANGTLFGAAAYGNTNNAGTIFEISLKGTYSTVTGFSGVLDGAVPYGSLIRGKDGNLYGTAEGGGEAGDGAVFAMSPNGAMTILHSFGTVPDRATDQLLDGSEPQCTLVQGNDGSFYGTTTAGGTNGDGTVFKITTNGTFMVLYAFGSVTNSGGTPLDGEDPQAGLILATDGNLYGTCAEGGAYDYGTVFQITTNGVLTVLYSFGTVQDGYGDPLDGANPTCALVQGMDGNLYGTCYDGGAYGYGDGGYGDGEIFQLSTSGTLNVLYNLGAFEDANFDPLDGANPRAGLIQGQNGSFYGTCTYGGDYTNYGTVFRVDANGYFQTLWNFDGGSDGADPEGGLVQGADGILYGTTAQGGNTNGFGTVFQTSTNGNFTALWNFTGGDDGANPYDSLLPAGNGAFFGVAQNGGVGGAGTLFEINLAPALQTPTFSGGTVTLNWDAVVGLVYQVQFTADLADPVWTNLGTPIQAASQTLQVQESVGPGQAFYRAVQLTQVFNVSDVVSAMDAATKATSSAIRINRHFTVPHHGISPALRLRQRHFRNGPLLR